MNPPTQSPKDKVCISIPPPLQPPLPPELTRIAIAGPPQAHTLTLTPTSEIIDNHHIINNVVIEKAMHQKETTKR